MRLTQSEAPDHVIIGWNNFSHQLAWSAWISSKFSMFHWIRILFILPVLTGVELSLSLVVTITEYYKPFSGIKLSIRSFCFILYFATTVNFSISEISI